MDQSKPSKSARKRDYLARQKLGEDLIPLQESDLLSMNLDDELLDAVLDAKRMSKHGALRRQKQYIGKLMGASIRSRSARPWRTCAGDKGQLP